MMKTKLIRIGNSRGIRLPKPMIQQASLGDDIELKVHNDSIIISSGQHPRSGWAAAARQAAGRGEDALLDPVTSTRFDDEEWEW